MRKEIIIFFCAFIIATLISCEPSYRTKSSHSSRGTYTIDNATYEIPLVSVERSTGTKKMYEKQSIEAVMEEKMIKFCFEDELLIMKWVSTPTDIFFGFNNKTDRPVSIVWDESRFIDTNGVSHKLIHSGIGYEGRNDSHPPTVVAARGTLEDFVHPADYFQREECKDEKSNNNQDHWRRTPFLPTQIKGTAEESREKVESLADKTFQVILALQIDNVRNDYVYTFKINEVGVTEKEQQPEKSHNEGKGSGRSSGRGTF
jgi:hypothetical protein